MPMPARNRVVEKELWKTIIEHLNEIIPLALWLLIAEDTSAVSQFKKIIYIECASEILT